ncbi:MAG: hypothetical protein U0167_17425 [bacterium]
MAPQETLADSPSADGVEQRAAVIAASLREDLLAVAVDVAGPPPRPAALIRALDLDKSLASRLLRGLRAQSPFELLHMLPSPTGLGMFLDAAAAAGADAAQVRKARATVEQFHRLLMELPGGRAGLDALTSKSVVEVKQSAERTAKQGVYKAMSYLLGFHCETVTSILILQPSANGQTVDGIDAGLREGIRRLRPGTPVAISSVDLTVETPRDDAPRLETLAGRAPSDPLSLFLPQFCDPSSPAIELFQAERHTIFALSDAASLQRPVTLASAFFIRNGWLPYRTGEQLEEGRSYLLHYPCKLLIRDLFIRDDLYVGAEPQIRLEFPSPTGPARPQTSSFPIRLNTLDVSAPIEHLGRGLQNAAPSGVAQHGRLLAHVFESTGLEPERFRGYRTRIVYPVPMITMGWWIPLSRPPGSTV